MAEVDPWDVEDYEPEPSTEAAPLETLQTMGFVALADNYTTPIAWVDPAKEVESVERESTVQQELIAMTQPYYGLAASALRDERYQRILSPRRRFKKPTTGRVEWVFTPEKADEYKDEYTYRFGVHYDMANPYEPTRLSVGVTPRFVEGDELFEFGVGFENQVAKYAFLQGRRPRYKKTMRTWDKIDSPMFTLGCLMSREDKKRHPELICGKLNSNAEGMLSASDHAQVDLVFYFGDLPMTVDKRTQMEYKWAGWLNAEDRTSRYEYNRLTDSFEWDGVRNKTLVASEDAKYALSVMLGLIPTNRL